MSDIIPLPRSVIVSAEIDRDQLDELVQNTCEVRGIGGYKVGIQLVLEDGLVRVTSAIKDRTDLPVVYDHQKGATDIPDMGAVFARKCRQAGIQAAIIFPQAGPETEIAWIKALQDEGLGVIVGGHMTHAKYSVKEGGWILDEGIEEMYRIGAEHGVRHFVVPGTKPDLIRLYMGIIEDVLQGERYTLYSPGFVAQGGRISDAAQVVGESFHAIVGRGIYQAPDMRAAAEEMTSQLR